MLRPVVTDLHDSLPCRVPSLLAVRSLVLAACCLIIPQACGEAQAEAGSVEILVQSQAVARAEYLAVDMRPRGQQRMRVGDNHSPRSKGSYPAPPALQGHFLASGIRAPLIC